MGLGLGLGYLRVEVGRALHEQEAADPHAVPQQTYADALEERLQPLLVANAH